MRSLILARLPAAWGWMLVPTYKVMLSISILLGCWWIVRRLKSEGWDERLVLNALILAVAGSLLGSKLFYFLQYGPSRVWSSAAVFQFYESGYSLYGGFVGGCLIPYLYLRLKGLPTAAFANACAPAMALGVALTRIGCFLRGCNFGAITALPWGIRFPPGTDAFQHHLSLGLIPFEAGRSLPVHPTQLYEVAVGLILLALALTAAPRWRYQGRIQLVMIYAGARFGLEFLRADAGGISLGFLTFAQGISLAILLAGTAVYWHFRSTTKAQGHEEGKTLCGLVS